MQGKITDYLHYKAKQMGIPINAGFELTARCNFNCPMCYVHLTAEEQQRRGPELTAQQWIDIAEQAKRAGTVYLLLTGGEPTLRPDFGEIYHHLSKMGFVISINSNGRLLEGALLEQLKADPPFRINVTLYGLSNEDYARQCGIAAYDRVLANIKALRAAGIVVRINLTITPDNAARLPELTEKARELGAHLQGGAYLFPPVRVDSALTGQNYRLDPVDAAKRQAEYERLLIGEEAFLRRAGRISEGQSVETLVSDECEEGDPMKCLAGRAAYWINWQGIMTPCAQMTTPGVSVPNVGFDAAWSQIREETEIIRLPKECAGCPHGRLCNSCAAKCFCETGAFDRRPDYSCRMAHAYVDEMKRIWEAQHAD